MTTPTLQTLNDAIDVSILQQHPALESVNEAYLTRLKGVAASRIEKECRRRFVKQAFQWTVSGQGDDRIIVPNIPLISVDKVTVTADDGVVTEILAAEFRFDPWGEIHFKPNTQTGYYYYYYRFFPRSFRNVLIDYTAGFDPLPDEIVEAVVQLTVYLATTKPEAASEKLGEYAITYRDEAGGLPANVRMLIGPYRLL